MASIARSRFRENYLAVQYLLSALVAQLDRVSVSETEGHAFESRRVHIRDQTFAIICLMI